MSLVQQLGNGKNAEGNIFKYSEETVLPHADHKGTFAIFCVNNMESSPKNLFLKINACTSYFAKILLP